MSSLPSLNVDIAEALKTYRERQVLTQAELARKLRIPLRSLQAYEAGAMPQPARRRRIISFLERTAA
jgi:transcriptional regulator with XRE-family HTH domain